MMGTALEFQQHHGGVSERDMDAAKPTRFHPSFEPFTN
jgi:hypothetical protein